MTPSFLLCRMAGFEPANEEEAQKLLEALSDRKGEAAQKMTPALVAAAEWFLGAGGVWGPADWITLTPVEQHAAAVAGQRQACARAVLAAKAARGGYEAAEVMAPLDGGEEEERLLLLDLLKDPAP